MKYKFNNFTGRLSAPSPLEIPSRFGKAAENPIIHYPQGTSFAKTLEGPKGFYGAVPRPLLQKMAMFQVNNSLPVHIKGGPFDKILYGVTAFVCAVGLIECFRVYYVLSYPQPKED
ncbi:cytochrome c oxidase subunit 7A-related protein, mitochondrial-like isoform X2 [Macrobrachium rosenbergii]|uniref:cytochrome c oxidase subunit 7A-related protein, mitochondrial-like isoform X2 n=1 Tax=Macrobrachium rosenbergii TaxID=79674 RepID=UPI0034D3AE0D